MLINNKNRKSQTEEITNKVSKGYYKVYKSYQCIICKAPVKKNFYFYSKVYFDNFESTADIYNCKNCSTGYTYPFLTERETEKLYTNYGSHTHDTKIQNSIFYKIFKFAEEKVINICLTSKSSTFNKIITSFIFQRFFQTFPLFTYKKNNKLKVLDIGCGSGYFLQLIQKAGCETYGIEINKKLVKRLNKNGIKAYLNLNTLIRKKITFDIIKLNHVIEHMVNPNKVLKDIRKISDKNTEIIIGVPNRDTLAKIFKENMFMHIPFHRLHLTKNGVNYLLKNNGYEMTYFRTKSCGLFSWSLLRYFKIKSNIYTIPIKLIEIMSLSPILDFLKIGDSQEVYAKKK